MVLQRCKWFQIDSWRHLNGIRGQLINSMLDSRTLPPNCAETCIDSFYFVALHFTEADVTSRVGLVTQRGEVPHCGTCPVVNDRLQVDGAALVLDVQFFSLFIQKVAVFHKTFEE